MFVVKGNIAYIRLLQKESDIELFVTFQALKRLKEKMYAEIASSFFEKKIVPSLPEGKCVGEIAFNTSDERLYVYTSAGWRKMPFADEIHIVENENGFTFK